VLTSQAKQGLERGHRSPPPVEAKRELIQIGLEVLVGDSMVCPTQPSLEIAKDSMHMRQDLMRSFVGTLRTRPMAVPQFGQRQVPLPTIGDDDRPDGHVGSDKPRSSSW
jgi:hypothetical protein